MKTKRMALLAAVILVVAVFGGCTVSNGTFIGMSQQSSDTSLSASYASFNGSLARLVTLDSGDEVHFNLEGGEGLALSVKQNGKLLFEITDGGAYTVPTGGKYIFEAEGKAQKGSFSLSWQTE